MCGRYTGPNMTQAQLRAIIEGALPGPARIEAEAPEPVTGDDIRPTQQVPIVFRDADGPVLSSARWWFVPHWHRGDVKEWKATTFNARVETARDKPAFRAAWASRRCLLPATGYYEWQGEKGKKQRWFITTERNTPLIFFAGLYSTLGDGMRTCTILTRPAQAEIADLHPRMPVILPEVRLDGWLTGDEETDEVIEALDITLPVVATKDPR